MRGDNVQTIQRADSSETPITARQNIHEMNDQTDNARLEAKGMPGDPSSAK